MNANTEKLVALRKRFALTQTEAAARIGISQDYLWRIESGRVALSASVLVAMAQVYGLSIDALSRRIGFKARKRGFKGATT